MFIRRLGPLIFGWAAFLFACGANGQATVLAAPESGFDGAVEIVDSGADGGIRFVTARIPYRDIHGAPKHGLGRLYVSEKFAGDALPAFIHVHYEKDLNGARAWCERGWAVASSHYDPPGGYLLDVSVGDGNNLQRALIQWVRRLPIIDRARLHIDGGSQGGYMALAMAADCFPVTSVTADAPVVNWAYNLNYFEANKPVSGFGVTPPFLSPVPVMAMVSELALEKMISSPVPGCYGVFGADLAADAWYYVSPVSYADRITAPVLAFAATGDMLVPHDQITDRFPRPFDETLFPAGYRRDFASLTLNDKARKTLEDVLGPEKASFYLEPLPEGIQEYALENALGAAPLPEGGMKSMERRWDPAKQWSIVILDEGGPLPHSPHSRYAWKTSPDGFIAHYKDAAPPVGLLTPSMYARLAERYAGTLTNAPALTNGAPVNRLNFPALERLDVVAGLLDYAAFGPEHAARLIEIAAASDTPLLDAPVTVASLEAERKRLLADLSTP